MLSYKGEALDIETTQQLFPIFPDLLFGEANEGKSIYFDATHFIKQRQLSPSSIDKFLGLYAGPINDIVKTFQLNPAALARLNKNGHVLMESNLLYPFLIFVEPDFLAWVTQRLDELFSTGVTVSDSFLYDRVKVRFPADVLKQLADGTGKQ